jgi:hypothetical protein
MKKQDCILVVLMFLFLIMTSVISQQQDEIFSPGKPFTPHSIKRILQNEPEFENRIYDLSGKDQVAKDIMENSSLIVGSKLYTYGDHHFYHWLQENLVFSSKVTNLYGDNYKLTEADNGFNGDDGKGLSITFRSVYFDSSMVIYIGSGHVKVLGMTHGGSFVNVIEYFDVAPGILCSQNRLFTKVDNSFKRFMVKVIFTLSNIEEGLMKKITMLDGTVIKMTNAMTLDPALPSKFRNPPPAEKCDALVTLTLKELSAQKLGELTKILEDLHSRAKDTLTGK